MFARVLVKDADEGHRVIEGREREISVWYKLGQCTFRMWNEILFEMHVSDVHWDT